LEVRSTPNRLSDAATGSSIGWSTSSQIFWTGPKPIAKVRDVAASPNDEACLLRHHIEHDIFTADFSYEVLFPTIWISGFGFGTLSLWLGLMHGKNGTLPPDTMKLQFLILWILGTVFLLLGCAGLKRVRIDSTNLYVSNYLTEITVPLKMILDVTEISWINIRPVTIHFRSTTAFGQQIKFMPTVCLLAPWRSHPVVAELKRLAGCGGQ
jgi:hypothetical protein